MRDNNVRQSLDMSIHALQSEIAFLATSILDMGEVDRICLKAAQMQLNRLMEVLEKRLRINTQALQPADVLAMIL